MPTYANLLCDNNTYLQNIVMIPLSNFQHATIDIPFLLDPTMDINQTTLQDMIGNFPWCTSIEQMSTPTKVLVITTKSQL